MSETVQDTPETDEKKSRALGSYVVWAFVAVMLYVLSSGPAVRLAVRGVINPGFLIVYVPLERVYENVPFVHRVLRSYLHFWCPEAFAKEES